MKKDWNTFMLDWNDLHRNKVLPYIHQASEDEREEISTLLSDMKSSLKWCNLEDCITISETIEIIVAL